jgi:hypothetical protein
MFKHYKPLAWLSSFSDYVPEAMSTGSGKNDASMGGDF